MDVATRTRIPAAVQYELDHLDLCGYQNLREPRRCGETATGDHLAGYCGVELVSVDYRNLHPLTGHVTRDRVMIGSVPKLGSVHACEACLLDPLKAAARARRRRGCVEGNYIGEMG